MNSDINRLINPQNSHEVQFVIDLKKTLGLTKLGAIELLCRYLSCFSRLSVIDEQMLKLMIIFPVEKEVSSALEENADVLDSLDAYQVHPVIELLEPKHLKFVKHAHQLHIS